MKLKEWQHHIKGTHVKAGGLAWCGKKVTQFDWLYQDIDHAAMSAPFDRIQPCPACVEAIVASLGGTSPAWLVEARKP
jgi:hypothetical protein